MGTAGDPAGWAAKERERALADPVNWRVSEPAGPPPWMDPAEVDVERSRLLPSTFARLFENKWVAGEDRLTSPEQVRGRVGHVGPLPPRRGVRYVHGLDVGLVSDRTVLTTGHAERRDGEVVVVVDRQTVWQGTRAQPVDLTEVEAACREAVRQYPGRLIADPWQSVHLCQRLRGRGVRVEPFTFSTASVGRLALTLYRLLRDAALDLPGDDEELLDELASVALRETQPGAYRIDTTGDGHDDRVVSLALVAQRLAAQPTGGLRLQVAEGSVPRPRPSSVATPRRTSEPPVAVVREGEPRAADRGPVHLGPKFRIPAKDRDRYSPPGWWR